MSRRSKRQSVADRRRNMKRVLRAAKAGDIIAIGYDRGAYKALVFDGESKEGMRVFRGWEPWPRVDRWGQPMWHLEPLRNGDLIGEVVSISWTAPGLPLRISLRGEPQVRQSFSEWRERERQAA